MSWSSCILSITRLLQHFDDANVKTFKKLLLNEFGCTNESQFLCKVVRLAVHDRSLTHESLIILKQEAIKLSEKQKCKSDQSISLYKQIQRQYNDLLSNLNSDIIDYLGTFLNKQESYQFGYLNKHLYMETQKQSYLLKRLNDETFSINDFTVDRFFWKQTNPFNYSLPKQLSVTVKGSKFDYINQQLLESQWYQTLFSCLNSFETKNLSYLSKIPIKTFFHNKESKFNYNYNGNRSQYIETFKCIWTEENNNKCSCINTFCNNFNNFFNDCKNNCNIRKIKQFIVHNAEIGKTNKWLKQIIMTLGPISDTICLNDVKISITNVNSLCKLFHPNLKHLQLNINSSILFNSNVNNFDDNSNNNEINPIACNLDHLSFVIYSNDSFDNSKIDLFSAFIKNIEKLNLRSNIKCFKLLFYKSLSNTCIRRILNPILNISNSEINENQTENENSNQITAKCKMKSNPNCNIFYDMKPATLLIVTVCETELNSVAIIFQYLNVARLQILDRLVNNIQTITIEFYLKECESQRDINIRPGQWDGKIWKYKSNKKYSVDENTIECNDCDLSEKQMGVLYQNIVKWFQNIQKKCGNEKLKEHYYLHLKLKKYTTFH